MFNKWAHYDWSERVQYFYLETYKKKLNKCTRYVFLRKILDDKCKELSTHLIRNASQSSSIEIITFGTCALDELIQECYRFFTTFILIFHHAGLKKKNNKYCKGKIVSWKDQNYIARYSQIEQSQEHSLTQP